MLERAIRATAGGAEIEIRVVPRARKTEIAGVRDDALLVRIAAPPVDDAANRALIDFLADRLGVPQRTVRLVSGDRGRRKRVAVAGVTAAFVRDKIERACGPGGLGPL